MDNFDSLSRVQSTASSTHLLPIPFVIAEPAPEPAMTVLIICPRPRSIASPNIITHRKSVVVPGGASGITAALAVHVEFMDTNYLEWNKIIFSPVSLDGYPSLLRVVFPRFSVIILVQPWQDITYSVISIIRVGRSLAYFLTPILLLNSKIQFAPFCYAFCMRFVTDLIRVSPELRMYFWYLRFTLFRLV